MDSTTLTITLAQNIIENLVIPELIRRHKDATGELPTDEQVLAQLGLDADAGIDFGEAFLRAKGAL